MPRLVDLNVYGESYKPKRDNVCKLLVLGYDLCIIKYHVQCKNAVTRGCAGASARHKDVGRSEKLSPNRAAYPRALPGARIARARVCRHIMCSGRTFPIS